MYEGPDSLSEMLKETMRLTQENNKLIKSMRRDAMIGGVVRVVLWIVVLVGSYYLTMQYLEPLLGSFGGSGDGSSPSFEQLLDQYKNQFGE